MPKFIDLSGQRFGELVVERLADIKLKNRPAWLCLCDCGERKVCRSESLRCGDNKSCGKHKTKNYLISHHGNRRIYPPGTDTHSSLYTHWRAMRARCENPSHEAYQRYGGRGITICDAWKNFAAYRDWALASGYANHLSIDRINNDSGYEPANCQWVTPKVQARNFRHSVYLTAFGETKLLVEWAEDARAQVSAPTLRKRLVGGQPIEFAITATEAESRHRASVLREAKKKLPRQHAVADHRRTPDEDAQ